MVCYATTYTFVGPTVEKLALVSPRALSYGFLASILSSWRGFAAGCYSYMIFESPTTSIDGECHLSLNAPKYQGIHFSTAGMSQRSYL